MPPAADAPIHLVLPLLSSLLFVAGALFAKAASLRGAGPVTNTVTANVCLAFFWTAFGLLRHGFLPPAAWGPVVGIACLFVLGQLTTYFAFQIGDVSLATPIFGVKIILVAFISSMLIEKPVPMRIWVAAFLASIGVAIVQMNPRRQGQGRVWTRQTAMTAALALFASTTYSVFDVSLQNYGRKFGAEPFLATLFLVMGLMSCLLLPWTDLPSRLRKNKALGPVALGAILIAGQAILISYALSQYGDATRINIVYALRGLWSVLLAWLLDRLAMSPEVRHSAGVMIYRLIGAAILLGCVVIVIL
jgi:drug/metabolite transporter (DMT)-like permease